MTCWWSSPRSTSTWLPTRAAGYTAIHDGAVQWLREKGVPCVVPPTLPSKFYADASHPLTKGYESLAKTVFQDDAFQKWLGAN